MNIAGLNEKRYSTRDIARAIFILSTSLESNSGKRDGMFLLASHLTGLSKSELSAFAKEYGEWSKSSHI